MPKFTLPEIKKPKKDKQAQGIAPSMDDTWRRHITIPANKEILDALNVGDECTITLSGKVNELVKREGAEYKDMHFGVEVSSVEAYPITNEKAEKQFSKGYKKGASK
jgi:hypothetical protein